MVGGTSKNKEKICKAVEITQHFPVHLIGNSMPEGHGSALRTTDNRTRKM